MAVNRAWHQQYSIARCTMAWPSRDNLSLDQLVDHYLNGNEGEMRCDSSQFCSVNSRISKWLMTVDDKYCHYQLALSVTAALREIWIRHTVWYSRMYVIISNTLIKYDPTNQIIDDRHLEVRCGALRYSSGA